MLTSLVVLLILLVLSGFMSSSETVLFGLSKHELYLCRQSRQPMRRLAAELMTRPRRVLLTILLANTTINVLIFASSFVVSDKLAEEGPIWATLWGIMTVALVVVVGEVMAKTLAMTMRFKLAPVVAPVIEALQLVLTPLRVFFENLVATPMSRLLVGHADPHPRRLEVDELRALVDISRAQGVIGPDERDMLQEVVALAAMRVRSIMVPRVDVVAFDLKGTRRELLALMTEHGLTKVPVYDKAVDQLLGIIHVKDLHLSPERPLRELVSAARFVPEQTTVDKLLAHFRDSGTQLAMVVDEYGGVSGLVTLEDVVEQIVGDISEPGESEAVQHIDGNSYRMAGDLSVSDWGQLLGLAAPFPRVTTLGGLVAAMLGRQPREQDEVELGNVRMVVERVKDNRVQWVRVQLAGEGS